MMTTQKVGYDGVLMFELAAAAPPASHAGRAASAARQRFEQLLVVF